MTVFEKNNLPPEIAAIMESTASMLTMMLEKGLMSSQDAIALLQRADRAMSTGQVCESTVARLEAALKVEELSTDIESKPAEQVG